MFETIDTKAAKRMLSINELMVYLSIGKTRAAEFGKKCGAEKHIGRRCLYDRHIIDRAIDSLEK